eukprot:2299379-Rhodomonas_salina.1
MSAGSSEAQAPTSDRFVGVQPFPPSFRHEASRNIVEMHVGKLDVDKLKRLIGGLICTGWDIGIRNLKVEVLLLVLGQRHSDGLLCSSLLVLRVLPARESAMMMLAVDAAMCSCSTDTRLHICSVATRTVTVTCDASAGTVTIRHTVPYTETLARALLQRACYSSIYLVLWLSCRRDHDAAYMLLRSMLCAAMSATNVCCEAPSLSRLVLRVSESLLSQSLVLSPPAALAIFSESSFQPHILSH